jgi:membrane peptidoglycan carboxypeptidase
MSHRRYLRGRENSFGNLSVGTPLGGTPRRRSSRGLLRLVLVGIIVFFTIASTAVAFISKDLPKPGVLRERATRESTKIYDRTGTTLLYEIGDIHRTRVPLADISPHMVHATVATEDREFYTHHGISLRGILRSILRARPGQRLQGGSTITQQLARNTLITPERTVSRKIREQLLALLVEQRFSKDEILEMYLNEIPYGSNAYGVEA